MVFEFIQGVELELCTFILTNNKRQYFLAAITDYSKDDIDSFFDYDTIVVNWLMNCIYVDYRINLI